MANRDLTPQECEILKQSLLSEAEYEALTQIFKIMADSNRLRIFTILSIQEVCVDDLRVLLDMSQSAVSHQLASLRKMNLVKVRKEGKHSFYSLSDGHVMQIFTQALEHVRE